MAGMVYNVYVTGLDPDDPDSFGYYGNRASLRGAQTLAEKGVKGRVYGWYARGKTSKEILETNEVNGRRARIVYDWPASSRSRDPRKRTTKSSKRRRARITSRRR